MMAMPLKPMKKLQKQSLRTGPRLLDAIILQPLVISIIPRRGPLIMADGIFNVLHRP